MNNKKSSCTIYWITQLLGIIAKIWACSGDRWARITDNAWIWIEETRVAVAQPGYKGAIRGEVGDEQIRDRGHKDQEGGLIRCSY